MKMVLILLSVAFVPLFNTMLAEETNKMLELTFTIRDGRGDEPMVVAWIENSSNEFVRTVHVFSKKKQYYKDLLAWTSKSAKKEKTADIDAVMGATIKWSKSATFAIPVKMGTQDLLDGSYTLRIESRKDNGNHYRDFKIPLPAGYAGGVHEDAGYVKSVDIKVKQAQIKGSRKE
jgi:hypothetical protein